MSTDDPIDTFAELSFDEPSMLPYAIPWRSPLYFELRNKHHWKTLYTWQDQPVVVQRQLGKGTVVMVADSYLLSNEGLRNHRSTGLLAWLVVPGHNIIFDEFNKGLIKKPGVAGLARQYRLHGVFAALLVIAALFIWRQSAVFIPSVRSEESSSVTKPASGRETSQGMVHLSRRHIGTKELLTVCFNTWKTQAAERTSNSSIAQVEALVKQAASDPRKEKQVETYKKVCELLKQGKRP